MNGSARAKHQMMPTDLEEERIRRNYRAIQRRLLNHHEPEIRPCITKTRLFKFIENFTTPQKKETFQIKFFDIFPIPAQKHRILVFVKTASARRGDSNEYPQSIF